MDMHTKKRLLIIWALSCLLISCLFIRQVTPEVTLPATESATQEVTEAATEEATEEATQEATPETTSAPQGGPVDPGGVASSWQAQSCRATIIARKNAVTMDITGKVNSLRLDTEKEYMLVVNADLTLEGEGKADINYGEGHIVTIYAPSEGSGSMKIVEWNGARRIAVTAGAGHVVENDALASCKLTVEAAGTVTLTSTGTDYVFVANPGSESGAVEVQLAVFDGEVAVDSIDQSGAQVGPGNAALLGDGQLQGIFPLQGEVQTRQAILDNLDQGLDIFGGQIINQGLVPTGSPGSGTITIWTAWSGQPYDHLMQVIYAYQEKYPELSFSVESVPFDQLLSRYQDAASAGEGPTLLIGPASWGVSLYDQGLAADVRPIMKSGDLEAFQRVALGNVSYGKVMTGAPLNLTGVVTYRNGALLPEQPGSLEYLEKVASDFNARGTPALFADVGFYFSGADYLAVSGAFMDSSGRPLLTQDNGADWLALLKRFANIGPTAFNDDSDAEAFINWTAAVIFDGSWNWQRYAENVGYDNLVIDPWITANGKPLSGFVAGDNAYLNPDRSTPEVEAGADFLRYLVSVDGQTVIAQAGMVPIRSDLVVNERYIRELMAAFEGGRAVPILPEMDYYYTPMNTAIQSFLYEESDPDTVLREAEFQINEQIEQ